MEGADNVAYICDTESLKEDQGESAVVFSCSCSSPRFASPGSRSPFPYVVQPRPDPRLPIVTGFLTEALLRYLFV